MTAPAFEEHSISFTLADVHLEMHSEDLTQHLGTLQLDRLNCFEGRQVKFAARDDDRWDVELTYDFLFDSPAITEPVGGFVGKPMAVHMIGTHANGCRLQLSGPGWVHVDDAAGLVDGSFDGPPEIVVLSGAPHASDEQRSAAQAVAQTLAGRS